MQAQNIAMIISVVLVGIILDLNKINVLSILGRKDIRIFVVFVNATTISDPEITDSFLGTIIAVKNPDRFQPV
jgi:hypothetical protein